MSRIVELPDSGRCYRVPVAELHEILAERVADWRTSGYAHATVTDMLDEEVLVVLDRS